MISIIDKAASELFVYGKDNSSNIAAKARQSAPMKLKLIIKSL